MIPNVVYIFSALLWSSFTRSITFPVLVLCFFNILVYWPYLETHDQHFFESLHAQQQQLVHGQNNSASVVDSHYHHHPHDSHHSNWDSSSLHEKIDHLVLADSSIETHGEGGDGDELKRAKKKAKYADGDDEGRRRNGTDRGQMDVDLPPGVKTIDQFRHYHLYYQFRSTGFFVLFSLVGYILSQTIRYPPMLDIIYLHSNVFYCFKVFGGIIVYHLTLAPLVVLGEWSGSLLCCVLSVAWSTLFYMVLTMETVRWQTSKSIRTFLFYLNVVLMLSVLFYATGVQFVDRDSQTTLIGVLAAFDILLILVIRLTLMKSRKLATCTKHYAADKYRSVIERHWFGFAFNDCDTLANGGGNSMLPMHHHRGSPHSSSSTADRDGVPSESLSGLLCSCFPCLGSMGRNDAKRKGGGGKWSSQQYHERHASTGTDEGDYHHRAGSGSNVSAQVMQRHQHEAETIVKHNGNSSSMVHRRNATLAERQQQHEQHQQQHDQQHSTVIDIAELERLRQEAERQKEKARAYKQKLKAQMRQQLSTQQSASSASTNAQERATTNAGAAASTSTTMTYAELMNARGQSPYAHHQSSTFGTAASGGRSFLDKRSQSADEVSGESRATVTASNHRQQLLASNNSTPALVASQTTPSQRRTRSPSTRMQHGDSESVTDDAPSVSFRELKQREEREKAARRRRQQQQTKSSPTSTVESDQRSLVFLDD